MARIQSTVGQKIVIYNHDKKILILKRSMRSIGPGTWDLPGGGILLHEDPIAGLEREIREETGLQVIGITPVYTAAKTYPDGTHNFLVGYTGILDSSSEVVLSHEHDEYLWINPQDIDTYALPEHRVMIVKKTLGR